MNHATSDACPYPGNQKTKRRLTSQDLRKQLRLREANTWITKHNERLRSTGSLRSKAHFSIKHDLQDVNELSKQARCNDKEVIKQRKAGGTLHKGFVCRTWAANFLENNATEVEDDEFIPFFVRKYVDNSKSVSAVVKNVITGKSTEKKETLQLESLKRDNKELTESNSNESARKLEITLEEKAFDDENNNTKIEDCTKASPGDFKSLQNISGRFVCGCGGTLAHDMEIKRRAKSTLPTRKYLDHVRSSSFRETHCVALPIKQFPPINPLEDMRKPNSQARIKRGILPARRPHTVDTAMVLKEAIVVNSHCNLPNYNKKSDLPSREVYHERDSVSPSEQYSNDRKLHPGVKFDKNWLGSKHFDEGLKMLCPRSEEGWRVNKTLVKSATSQCAVHDSNKHIQERRGRCRSLSVPPGNNKQSRMSVNKNQNVMYGNIGNRLPLKAPPYSPNGEDNDSGTDSNDTGLGSEIEYAFDGSAKLDIYLQPRGTSFR